MKPRTLIIRTAGTNCDRELAYAFESAGAQALTLHLNRLIDDPAAIDQAHLIGFPGGFSYGDDVAAGRIFANRLRHRLWEPLRSAVRRGVPMIGICNGFQALAKLGLLPDPLAGGQAITLADNTTGRFTAKWVSLEVPRDTVCVWTRGLDRFDLPIAHGEGRFVTASPEVLETLKRNHQIALRYSASGTFCSGAGQGCNPNGSVDDIAGVCDPSGRVLGLMPHPERHTDTTHHPLWTRQVAERATQTPAGLQMFINAVEVAQREMASHAVAG